MVNFLILRAGARRTLSRGCDWNWVRSCRLKPAFRLQWNAGFSRQPRSTHPHLITPLSRSADVKSAVSPSCTRQTIQVFSRAKIGGPLRPAQMAPACCAEPDQLKIGRDRSIRPECPGRDSSSSPPSQLDLSGAIFTYLDLSRPNWNVLIPAV